MAAEAQFDFDVFLSHSSKDKDIVRPLAEQLEKDGIKVWFDERQIQPGDNIPAKIEYGLERSQILVLCMSESAFSSDWTQLEAGTFRFRDPLNKERRFVPIRLDDSQPRGSLAQVLHVDYRPDRREQGYAKILVACRPPELPKQQPRRSGSAVSPKDILCFAVTRDGSMAISGCGDGTVRFSHVKGFRSPNLNRKQSGQVLRGHSDHVWSVAWSPEGRYAVSGSNDATLRVWDTESKSCLRILEGHTGHIDSVAISGNQRSIVSGGDDGTLRIWDWSTGRCKRVLKDAGSVYGIDVNEDGTRILSGTRDSTVRLWDAVSGRCVRVLEGHTGQLRTVKWSPDERYALSAGEDGIARVWDVETGQCLRTFESETEFFWSVAWSENQQYIISGGANCIIRLWRVDTGECIHSVPGHKKFIRGLYWSPNQLEVISGDAAGQILVTELPQAIMPERSTEIALRALPLGSDRVQYTNAKVLLVGESGAGKTGLSKVLAGEEWRPSDSTVGAWATQWSLPHPKTDDVEREIWLWDFGGQADQRLIHQLYMDETALAVLVFDGQKEDLFEVLRQWDRDLTRASTRQFSKLLVAGRVDAGGLRVSKSRLEAFGKERGYSGLFETSAKTGAGCEELKEAIAASINWEEVPWRSSPHLFKQLKDQIIRLKDEGRILIRFNELREALQLRLSAATRFSDEQLHAVVGLLTGPGIVWELSFGSLILLQPERINAYAQSVIQTMRTDEHERGCIAEERVLTGNLIYQSSMSRLDVDEERFVLIAMHQLLMERGLCLREHTDRGPLLVFPSYYRRERPELVGHPAVLVSYRFDGFMDDIYATLVVRLHHTKPFEQDSLWRYAADFKTVLGKQLGVKLNRRAEGSGELEVYFDPLISLEEKIIFSRYVHEHLLANAANVQRLRYYVCPFCGTPVGNRDVAMTRLEEGKTDIVCVNCENRVPLWDQLEELFASKEIRARVWRLQKQSDTVLDNESKERALVGEVISTVALAGQISREFTVSDHGIDMEIEFKSDLGEATGFKVYLQLKSGDSHLTTRKSDGAEIFKISKARHAEYWREQAFPVLLLIRNSAGEISWMDIRRYLRAERDRGAKGARQIVFSGERFDVMSVRRWRGEALGH